VSVLDLVEFRLKLRDALELYFLFPQNAVEHFATLVEEINQAIELLTADVHPAGLRDAPDLRSATAGTLFLSHDAND
jgi:hypothetical protein